MNFSGELFFETLISQLVNFIEKQNIKSEKVNAFFEFDPMAYRSINGQCFPHGEGNGMQKIKRLLVATHGISGIKILGANASIFPNAGSSPAQELGFALAMGADYLAKASNAKLPLEALVPRMAFTFSAGAEYFIEIAKLRAARLLWAKIVEQYVPENPKIGKMYIKSINTQFNKTLYDPHVNTLRSTTEAMAAIIGGCNALQILPYDYTFSEGNDFSAHIAKNIAIILNEEAYFNQPQDSSAGAYYIENLTDKMAEKAWAIFLDIEQNGGFVKSIKANYIQQKIEAIAQLRYNKFARKQDVLLGTNQYPNQNETVNQYLKKTKNIDFTASNSLPLNSFRLAAPYEKIRLDVEQSGYRPKVFLLTFGNLAMRKARASFAANHLAVAGYEIIENTIFSSLEEATKESLRLNADITVLCSSDTEYEMAYPKVKQLIGKQSIILIAGNITDELKALFDTESDYSISAKSILLEDLQTLQNRLAKRG